MRGAYQARAQHALAIVEAAYSLDGTDPEWLARILEAAEKDLSYGCGSYGFTCRIGERKLIMGPAYVERALDPRFSAFVGELNRTAPSAIFDMLARSAVVCGGVVDVAPPEVRTHFSALGVKAGFPDGFSLLAQDGEGYAIDVSAPADRRLHAHPRVRGIWNRVGVHLAAAMRLRRRLVEKRMERDALFAPSGKLEHAEGDIRDDRSARASLTAAVRAVERARSAGERADPEGALALWRGLVAGEWSLVDHWDGGGRRYIAAYKNRPEVRDPRALTPQERLIFRYAALGVSNKEIAFTLGLSTGTVAFGVRQLLLKLRCRRRSDLLAFANPERAALMAITAGDDELGVLSLPHAPRSSLIRRLSAAERDVARAIIGGSTNAAIARARGTSPNTVANQVRRIFDKLAVGSRTELARALTGG